MTRGKGTMKEKDISYPRPISGGDDSSLLHPNTDEASIRYARNDSDNSSMIDPNEM